MTLPTLQRAIDYLGAVEVAPGRYAYQAHTATQEWRVTSHLERLAALLAGPSTFEQEHYPIEAAHLESVTMPAWWTPEQRYVWRVGSLPTRYASRGQAWDQSAKDTPPERITANLETGAEVPA